jgi:hypothetical protein
MYDLDLMQMFYSQEQFKDELFDPRVRQLNFLLVLQIWFQITFVAMLKQNTQSVFGRKIGNVPHDVGMINSFHYLALF